MGVKRLFYGRNFDPTHIHTLSLTLFLKKKKADKEKKTRYRPLIEPPPPLSHPKYEYGKRVGVGLS